MRPAPTKSVRSQAAAAASGHSTRRQPLEPNRRRRARATTLKGLLEDLAQRPQLALLAGYLLLAPFYVLRSGLPQPADLLMVVLIALTAFSPGYRFPRGSRGPRRALFLFILYVCAVNILWVLVTGNFSFGKKNTMLIYPVFYLYNGLVFAALVALYHCFRERLLASTIHLVAASVILQAVLATRFLSATTFRQELFFNNPNQLGYYVLLSATIVVIGSKYLKVNVWYQAIFFLGAIYLAMLSLSNAALISLGVLIVVAFSRRFVVLVTTLVLLFGAFQFSNVGPKLVDNVALRLGRIGTGKDDNLAGRGYDRIAHHPTYLILGAGEGGLDRVESQFEGELHSTVGTLLFSYGVAGTFLFFSFLFSLIGRRPTIYLYVAPVFLYGLTHQGLRFTHFWILWAFILCLLIEAKGRAPRLPRPNFHFGRRKPIAPPGSARSHPGTLRHRPEGAVLPHS
ncbi:MAG: hypothetical protein OES47_03680 [Acidobacteriota bacterium]|nr:hypothetical protein [Acidobacteriota bacterium]